MTSTVPEAEYMVLFETIDGSPCDLSRESREGLSRHFRNELRGKLVQSRSFRIMGKNVVRVERINPLTPHDMVKQFHETFGHPVHTTPTDLSDKLEALRVSLLTEEVQELQDAVALPQSTEEERQARFTEIADALADILYVTYGAAHAWGIPLDEVTAEVHRSNLTKLGEDGKPIYAPSGKVLKGPNFEEPDIAGVLFPPVDEEADEEE